MKIGEAHKGGIRILRTGCGRSCRIKRLLEAHAGVLAHALLVKQRIPYHTPQLRRYYVEATRLGRRLGFKKSKQAIEKGVDPKR